MATEEDLSGEKCTDEPSHILLELQLVLHHIEWLRDGGDIAGSIAFTKEILNFFTPELNPAIWAVLYAQIGITLAMYPSENRQQQLEQAIAHFSEAIKLFPEDQYPTVYQNLRIAEQELAEI